MSGSNNSHSWNNCIFNQHITTGNGNNTIITNNPPAVSTFPSHQNHGDSLQAYTDLIVHCVTFADNHPEFYRTLVAQGSNTSAQSFPQSNLNLNQPPNLSADDYAFHFVPSSKDLEFSSAFKENKFVSDDPSKAHLAYLGWDMIVDRKRKESKTVDELQASMLDEIFNNRNDLQTREVAQLCNLAKDFRKQLFKFIKDYLRIDVYKKFNTLCERVRESIADDRMNPLLPSWLFKKHDSWSSLLQMLKDTSRVLKQEQDFLVNLPELKLPCWITIDSLQSTSNRGPKLKELADITRNFFQYDDSGPGLTEKPKGGQPFTSKIVSMCAQDARTKTFEKIGIDCKNDTEECFLKSLPMNVTLHFPACRKWETSYTKYVGDYISEKLGENNPSPSFGADNSQLHQDGESLLLPSANNGESLNFSANQDEDQSISKETDPSNHLSDDEGEKNEDVDEDNSNPSCLLLNDDDENGSANEDHCNLSSVDVEESSLVMAEALLQPSLRSPSEVIDNRDQVRRNEQEMINHPGMVSEPHLDNHFTECQYSCRSAHHPSCYGNLDLSNPDNRRSCSLCLQNRKAHYVMKDTVLPHFLCERHFQLHDPQCAHSLTTSYSTHDAQAEFMSGSPLKQCSVCGVEKPLSDNSLFHYCHWCKLHRVCDKCYMAGNVVAMSHSDVAGIIVAQSRCDAAGKAIESSRCASQHAIDVSLCTHDDYDDRKSYQSIISWTSWWNLKEGRYPAHSCSRCGETKVSQSNNMFVCRHCWTQDAKHFLCKTCWDVSITTGPRQRRKAGRKRPYDPSD